MKKLKIKNDLVSVTEAAKILDVSREYVRQMIHGKEIPAQKIGSFFFIEMVEVLRLKNRKDDTGQLREKKKK